MANATLKRKMEARHLLMISLGGVIGTGLFLSSGYTIHQAGPIGTILAYALGAVLVYLVMLCLGELAVAMPFTGSFHVYATKYIGPGTGFTVALLYWLTWTVALGSEFTAAGLIMQKWFPHTPTWLWSALFMIAIFIANALSVRFFAETEFWFSSIKVIAIIAFIVLGGAAIIGLLPISGYHHAPGLHNLVAGGIFPNGIKAVFTTMLTVNFAFSGTELIGVTAGETKDPGKNIPKAIHTTLLRLCLFFIGSIVVMAALIPYQKAGVSQSPFVLVFRQIGLPFAGDLMNFVVLTAILSAANSGLYASTRMLWSLANEKMIPARVAKTTKSGIPLLALSLSMLGGILALLSSVVAAETVYLVLVSISGLAVVIVWMAIALSQLNFRKQFLAEGHQLSELTFRTPGYPWIPLAAFILSFLSCVLIIFDPTQRPALFYMVPFIIACYVIYYVKEAIKKRRTQTNPAPTQKS
ncbi:MAG: amino acid permease [Loigolactobacillus coryniformis]|nr:amino acid permease [Loigolactobacillus coryniformis]OEH90625.1 amino acid permease [Loigolactobacillus coryniformis subsp. coryniformis]RRG05935.1 MAG: amino acid permease [Lactobacillus sp.]ATO56422.1 amino acid permease [Loigolactobacillus coryniformis subsp. coryniformis KCTC 3167 = DSM 20001]MBW4803384.1 amino acid permease [Loigolactobacillus coryniformis subsp. torquens]MBW4806080.1 amino acid permease [Loigolactobacillus coryniformis subsp. torquens]